MRLIGSRDETQEFPVLLTGAALLFWGVHNAFILLAVVMVITLEGARLVKWRWDLGDGEFNRVADLSGLLFLGVVLYQFNEHSVYGIYVILQWLPMVLFLLTAAQTYSTRNHIKLSALFLTLRRAESKGQIEDAGNLDIRYPFFAVCLVSASAGSVRTHWFYAGMLVLLAWLLWSVRPKRYPTPVWVTVLLVAGGLGYAGQAGVIKLRRSIEPWMLEWIQEHSRYRDPFRAYTAIGHIGKLKLSDRIILRVGEGRQFTQPLLLREASYQMLSQNMWLAGDTTFNDVRPDRMGNTWTLHERRNAAGTAARARASRAGAPQARRIEIAAYLQRGRGLLALPNGTSALENLNVEELKQNNLGALKVMAGPGLVNFTARYDPSTSFDALPSEADLRIPREYQAALNIVAEELGLAKLDPADAVRRIAEYFSKGFEYSVIGRAGRLPTNALGQFLLETKTGHCEYFATASVLLLRKAGIPARYATGYSVQEYSELEESYVVRKRHAHSWALAFVEGRWQDVDTTPPFWGQLEAETASSWESVYDLWSWAAYQYSRWRWSPSEEGSMDFLIWLVVPLSVILLWRLSSRRRVAIDRGGDEMPRSGGRRPGADSEFYLIEQVLRAAGQHRHGAESLKQWILRLDQSGKIKGGQALLGSILPKHYRYRFDPAGLTPAERAGLRSGVREWLDRYGTNLDK